MFLWNNFGNTVSRDLCRRRRWAPMGELTVIWQNYKTGVENLKRTQRVGFQSLD